MVVAEVWRDERGRQANLAALLKSVDVVPVDEELGRSCGVLLGLSRTSDPIDAALALIAHDGDEIITGDANDLTRLVTAARRAVRVVTA